MKPVSSCRIRHFSWCFQKRYGNGAILWKSWGNGVCRRGCWCAAALILPPPRPRPPSDAWACRCCCCYCWHHLLHGKCCHVAATWHPNYVCHFVTGLSTLSPTNFPKSTQHILQKTLYQNTPWAETLLRPCSRACQQRSRGLEP